MRHRFAILPASRSSGQLTLSRALASQRLSKRLFRSLLQPLSPENCLGPSAPAVAAGSVAPPAAWARRPPLNLKRPQRVPAAWSAASPPLSLPVAS
eukprot:scaffold842_cov227-Pinguiococcus_pyrenoidosus.AAC.5